MYLCKPFTINENSSTPWTQPIWVNHVHLVFASLSLSIYIHIHTSDRSNLAKVTNLTLSVVPKSSLILCINIWRRLWETTRKAMSVLSQFFTSAMNLQNLRAQNLTFGFFSRKPSIFLSLGFIYWCCTWCISEKVVTLAYNTRYALSFLQFKLCSIKFNHLRNV